MQVTYTSLLSECAKLGRAEQAAQILSQMRYKATATAASAIANDAAIGRTHPSATGPFADGSYATPASVLLDSNTAKVATNQSANKSPQQSQDRDATAAAISVIGSTSTASSSRNGSKTIASGDTSNAATSTVSSSTNSNVDQDLLHLFGKAKRVDEAFAVLEGMISRRQFPDNDR